MIYGFVFEEVPEKDREFLLSMGLKNCWGQIPVPPLLWDKKDEVVDLIEEAFSVDQENWELKYIKSITININCEPTLALTSFSK